MEVLMVPMLITFIGCTTLFSLFFFLGKRQIKIKKPTTMIVCKEQNNRS
jgi:hypothetical protein